MARSRQSVKRNRTDAIKARRNQSKMRALRTAIRNVREAEKPEDKIEAVNKANSLIDKAGRTRLIHPNKAARLKSAINK